MNIFQGVHDFRSVLESRLPVGFICQDHFRIINALEIATRCDCPQESSVGLYKARSFNPK